MVDLEQKQRFFWSRRGEKGKKDRGSSVAKWNLERSAVRGMTEGVVEC